MAYFVAAGKSITTPRGMITGGDEDSEVTWKTFCRDANNKEFAQSARESIKRHLASGTLVEADEMPVTPEQVRAQEALERDTLSQTVPLQLPPKPSNDAPPDGPTAAPPVHDQSVSMHHEEPAPGDDVHNETVNMHGEDETETETEGLEPTTETETETGDDTGSDSQAEPNTETEGAAEPGAESETAPAPGTAAAAIASAGKAQKAAGGKGKGKAGPKKGGAKRKT